MNCLLEPWTGERKPVKNWFRQPVSQDRRKAERHSAPRLVAYYWDGAAPQEHAVRDISSTGLYLITEECWYPSTLVAMTLQGTGSTGSTDYPFERSIAVQARVIRSDADGVGFALVLAGTKNPRSGEGLMANETADKATLDRFLQPLWTKRRQAW